MGQRQVATNQALQEANQLLPMDNQELDQLLLMASHQHQGWVPTHRVSIPDTLVTYPHWDFPIKMELLQAFQAFLQDLPW